MRAKKNWIRDAIKKPGSLRRALKVPKGEKIPEQKLDKAMHSKSPLMRTRAKLASTLKKLPRHKGPR